MEPYRPDPMFAADDVDRVRRNFRRRLVPLLVLVHLQLGVVAAVQGRPWWISVILPVSLVGCVLVARRGVRKMESAMLGEVAG